MTHISVLCSVVYQTDSTPVALDEKATFVTICAASQKRRNGDCYEF